MKRHRLTESPAACLIQHPCGSPSRLAAIALATALALLTTLAQARTQPRERVSLNANWRFNKGDPADVGDKLSYASIKPWIIATGSEFTKNPEAAAQAKPEGNPGTDVAYTQSGFDDSGWRQLDLPHDWGIEGPFKQEYPGETGKLPWWGVAWYRKHFNVPASDQDRRLYLDVDGAMSYATVWLNGHLVGGWPYGYASWRVDLTPGIKFGAENVLAIRLDNPPDSSRWYPGGGIYRNVWLVKTAPVHVAHWGTHVYSAFKDNVPEGPAEIHVQTRVANSQSASESVTVKCELYDPEGKPVTHIHQQADLSAHSERDMKFVIVLQPTAQFSPVLGRWSKEAPDEKSVPAIHLPILWSPESPRLYKIVTVIEHGGHVVDTYETPFGIRTIHFDADKGFFLNGEPVEIKGVCNHHDLGALGTAINTRALERQIELLKEMGCNAIRTSHNPPAPELLDLCDRLGMLVMDEAFDCWRRGKNRNDYQKLFEDWHGKDLRALVRRDRNHPCVVLWSIGNEILEQRDPDGWKLAAQLVSIVHDEDPTRPVTAAMNDGRSATNGFQKAVDVFGFNYKPTEYGKFRVANPAVPLFASETASCVSSRGEYFFPVSTNKREGRFNFQVSSYDLYAPPWATPPDTEFKGQDEFSFVAGEFVWTGFDYLGEPTPYDRDTTNLPHFTDAAVQAQMAEELKTQGKIKVPSRSSYFGILDLCGFKKDRFYIYQARWRPDLPMAHILPHWNWPERVGQVTPVHVYTSGDEAELFLNGKSLGRKKREPFQYRLRWDDVMYQPGELKVVAYKNGKKWATDVVKTTGPAAKLTLQADRNKIRADGKDLSFITVTVADKDSLLVPRSQNRIRFELAGPGEIVAVDNGDATSHESFQLPERNVFNGLCLVIVRSKDGKAGTITLTAKSDGLKDAAIRITSRAAK